MKRLFIGTNSYFLFLVIALVLISGGHQCFSQEAGTLYFFTNENCRPCKQLEPVLRGLTESGYPITKVDTNQYPKWKSQFRITQTPTVVLVKGNREIQRHSGFVTAATVKSWFHMIGWSPENRFASAKTDDAQTFASSLGASRNPKVPDFVKAHDEKRRADEMNGDRSTMHKGTRIPTGEAEAMAMEATVRIRVEDPGGISYATGTVIHDHNGEWLVLTCGHLFRDSNGRGDITVEYDFSQDSPRQAPARLLSYDAGSRDIGLIAVNAGQSIRPIQIAQKTANVARGKGVFSVGCDHGEPPTIRRTKIKRKSRYDKELITKYDIYGRPVDGRSGGGLFTEDGQLVGVCNAAAVDFDEGIYTALDTIYWQLDRVNLAHLFEGKTQPPRTELAQSQIQRPQPVADSPMRPVTNIGEVRRDKADSMVGGTPFGRNRSGSPIAAIAQNRVNADSPIQTPFGTRGESRGQAAPSRVFGRASVGQNANPITQVAAWDNSRSSDRANGDLEVILIVRSKTDPTRTDAITLSDPSPKLLKYLEKIGNRQTGESRIDMAQLRHSLVPENSQR